MRASVSFCLYGTYVGCRWNNIPETLTCWSQNRLFFCKLLYVKQVPGKCNSLAAYLVKLLEYVQLWLFMKAEPLFKFQIYCGLWSDFSNFWQIEVMFIIGVMRPVWTALY